MTSVRGLGGILTRPTFILAISRCVIVFIVCYCIVFSNKRWRLCESNSRGVVGSKL